VDRRRDAGAARGLAISKRKYKVGKELKMREES